MWEGNASIPVGVEEQQRSQVKSNHEDNGEQFSLAHLLNLQLPPLVTLEQHKPV
jgi:hypothetical protein